MPEVNLTLGSLILHQKIGEYREQVILVIGGQCVKARGHDVYTTFAYRQIWVCLKIALKSYAYIIIIFT